MLSLDGTDGHRHPQPWGMPGDPPRWTWRQAELPGSGRARGRRQLPPAGCGLRVSRRWPWCGTGRCWWRQRADRQLRNSRAGWPGAAGRPARARSGVPPGLADRQRTSWPGQARRPPRRAAVPGRRRARDRRQGLRDSRPSREAPLSRNTLTYPWGSAWCRQLNTRSSACSVSPRANSNKAQTSDASRTRPRAPAGARSCRILPARFLPASARFRSVRASYNMSRACSMYWA